ncbi:3-oxo-5-alpha-steroid 4-dehydrogenase-domain-containing protein [Dichomitus squalens]|uniref:3-oxo-5-alpha-steroid 4-dehydrogenase-domain-containing protein n=1 Tax=Dichomitus squalens TaxID=114155 RepID=A0A4Q9M6J5_9APHY|nr:3-oxo-5-alpha-steroid 4-dehydrogenase-domain-containing protein [Dichomitus squalens]
MELVAQVAFSGNSYPLSPSSTLALTSRTRLFPNTSPLSPTHPPKLTALLFSHLMLAVSAVFFNTINSSSIGHSFLADVYTRSTFWLWAAGFTGNIMQDVILLNICRKAKRADDNANNENDELKQEHYAIPHGLLHRFILYPNYFWEWVEWLGFALATLPVPSFALTGVFVTTVSPQWLFFKEVLPRAYKGHKRYHSKFPDYPKERKVVIPFLF